MVASGGSEDEGEQAMDCRTRRSRSWMVPFPCSCCDDFVFRRGLLGRRCGILGVEVVGPDGDAELWKKGERVRWKATINHPVRKRFEGDVGGPIKGKGGKPIHPADRYTGRPNTIQRDAPVRRHNRPNGFFLARGSILGGQKHAMELTMRPARTRQAVTTPRALCPLDVPPQPASPSVPLPLGDSQQSTALRFEAKGVRNRFSKDCVGGRFESKGGGVEVAMRR